MSSTDEDNSSTLIAFPKLVKRLGRGRATLERDIRRGYLPAHVWIGGVRYFRVRDIERWIDQGCPRRKVKPCE